MKIPRCFRPDYDHYAGARPCDVWQLRLMFLLIFLFLGYDSRTTLLMHQGTWNHVRVAALCMWGSFALLSIAGVFYPLKMVPLVAFEILYKSAWLILFAYPAWKAHELTGPAAEMTRDFLGVLWAIVAMPWRYALRTYVLNRPTLQV